MVGQPAFSYIPARTHQCSGCTHGRPASLLIYSSSHTPVQRLHTWSASQPSHIFQLAHTSAAVAHMVGRPAFSYIPARTHQCSGCTHGRPASLLIYSSSHTPVQWLHTWSAGQPSHIFQ